MPARPPAGRRRRPRRFGDPLPYGLLALGIAFFARPLLLGWSFYFRDLHMLMLPGRQLMAELWRQGVAPLWNPYLHGGSPLIENPINAGFYPSSLLYVLLPVERAMNVDLAGHVVFASLAAYALARTLALSRQAAAATGIVYAYAGVTLSQLSLVRLLPVPYLPLVLLCVHRLLAGGDASGRPARRARWLLIAALCGALQLLAGSPEMAALGWITALVWTLAWASPGRRGRGLALLAVVVGLAALLAAVAVVPLLALAGESGRVASLGFEVFATWSVPWRRLPELLVPGYLGPVDRLDPEAYWGSALVDLGFPMQPSLYLGIPSLALALAAVASRSRGGIPRRVRLVLGGFAVAAVVLSTGRHLPGCDLVFRSLPPLQHFRYPEKLVMLAVLPVALLAGWSVHRMRREKAGTVRAWAGATAALGAALCAGAALSLRTSGVAGAVEAALVLRAEPAIAAGLSARLLQATAVSLALVMALLLTDRKAPRAAVWLVVAVLAADLLAAGRRVNPVTPAAWFFAEPPAAARVRAEAGDGRLYAEYLDVTQLRAPPDADAAWGSRRDRWVLDDALGSLFRIRAIFHSDIPRLAPRRTERLGELIRHLPWQRRVPLLSAAAVRVVLARSGVAAEGLAATLPIADPGDTTRLLYRHATAAPRYRWIGVWHSVPTADAALRAMLAPGYDPRRHAVVEDASHGDQPRPCPSPARLVVREPTPNGADVEVASACPGYLVVADSWAPGWRYRVDGVRVSPVHADYAFAAVPLAAGAHRVERRYRPPALLAGLLVSAVTALGLCAAALSRAARRRRVRSPAASSRAPSAGGGAPPR
jgi:hypothetical protein